MNTAPLKNFAAQSRNILKQGVLNRILALGFDIDGNVIVPEPTKIQGGTIFMDQLMDESLYDAWKELKFRIASHGIKEVCEEAAYTWFNRLVAIRIMQKNHFIEPVMQYANEESRMPVIVAQARAGRLTLSMNASTRDKLNNLLADPTLVDEQFALLIEAFCEANPVIYNCFGGIDKYVSLLLPDNILAKGGFIDLLNSTTYLTDDDYKQSELIGWLYQFYISEKKDEVFDKFKKGKKAEAEDIPAATQIFTPNWIVKYMVQNTLGRTYLDNNPGSPLVDEMKYLVKTDEPTPEDAILKIDDITGYKMIDPACGSGHILNEGFDLLYAMYMEDFYSPRTAIENIFQKNLIGIDLDTRAKQLATFALLMKAASKDKSFLDAKVMPRVFDMPEPFVYPCPAEEFFPHYGICGEKTIKECTEAFELLRQASNLGSIMKFNISDETRYVIEKQTAYWEPQDYAPDAIKAALPSMRMILALTDKYTAVVANPPYMGASNMNDSLKGYVVKRYPESKYDLFSVFIEQMIFLCSQKGGIGCITMEAWMFLSSFETFRLSLLDNVQIESLSHFGWHIIGIAFGTAMTIFRKMPPSNRLGEYSYLTIDDIDKRTNTPFVFPKTDNGRYSLKNQSEFKRLPGACIGYWVSDSFIDTFSERKIGAYSDVITGMTIGDNNKYLRLWSEVDSQNISFSASSMKEVNLSQTYWIPYSKGGARRQWYGNHEYVVNWSKKDNFNRAKTTLSYLYLKEAITWPFISSNRFSARFLPSGSLWDVAGSPCFFETRNELLYTLGFLTSKLADYYLNVINPTINVQAVDIKNLPLIFDDSRIDIVKLCRQCILIAKLDWDAHETSWDFKTNELVNMKLNCGQKCFDLDMHDEDVQKDIEAISYIPTNRNLISDCFEAYKNKWNRNFYELHSNEEELNRQFIEIYGLQNELTPDVPLNEITILQQGEVSIDNSEIVWHPDVIMKQLISYAVGCWMGRYRLDKEGLNIGYYPKDEEICNYDVNGYQFTIDDDAIIPLMPHQNPFEDDNALQKIVNFVKMVFGTDNLTENLNFIEHCLGKSIEDYMMKDFWKDHLKMYQNRPIYWLFSSQKGAFQVLVYMHRMNPYTAEKVRTKYLLPYIDYLEAKIQQDRDRGADLSTIERKNLSRMEVALEECKEYHDRLHVVADKAIDFDLDDGVVVNYQKFGDVLPVIYKKKEK